MAKKFALKTVLKTRLKEICIWESNLTKCSYLLIHQALWLVLKFSQSTPAASTELDNLLNTEI